METRMPTRLLIDSEFEKWIKEVYRLFLPTTFEWDARTCHLEVMASMFGRVWSWGQCLRNYTRNCVSVWTCQFGNNI